MKNFSPHQKRSPLVTFGSGILALIFLSMAIASWLVTYEAPLPGEWFIRLITCVIFLVCAVVLAQTSKRGYTKIRIRHLLRDLLSGGL